ncbi:MAG: hypothetical protein ABWY02_01770 [Telluria sp.]
MFRIISNYLDTLGIKQVDCVLILACGTSYYAGLTAKYGIESWPR